MGLVFRKRRRVGRASWLNFSRSGVSASRRAGLVTVNSRGRISVRIAPGVYWRIGR